MLIAQLTDLHLRPRGLPANRVVETNMLTERAFRALAARRPLPDAVLLTGDLTDSGASAEYALLAELLARYPVAPVFAIPGNHDAREAMIAGLPATRHADGFVQYAVEGFPVRLVMLDTVVPGAGHGELCARRLDWLDATLAAAPDRPTLIGMHHPPIATGIGHMDRLALRRPEGFASVLERHPQVRLVVCGHDHRGVFARLGNAIVSIAPSVAHQVAFDLREEAPSALVLEPPAYQLHHWRDLGRGAAGFVSHTVLVEDYPGPFPFLAAE